MDKEEKTPPPSPPPTEAARIEKGIWRIEYKAAHYDESVKREKKNGGEILAPIGLHAMGNIEGERGNFARFTGGLRFWRNVSIALGEISDPSSLFHAARSNLTRVMYLSFSSFVRRNYSSSKIISYSKKDLGNVQKNRRDIILSKNARRTHCYPFV